MYCVYWIRLESHTDVTSQGYVGITKNLKERLKAHRKNKRKTRFSCAIKSHGFSNLIVEVLHENLSLQEALSIEQHLRPTQAIGWNCQKGGELGVESSWYENENNRSKHSEATSQATKLGIKLKDSKEARSLRAKKCHDEGKYKGSMTGSKNSRAILNEEQVKVIKYTLLSKYTNIEIANMYNVKPYVIQFIRKGKNWKHV